MPKELIFAGKAQAFGGLSNERELVSLCPEEFKRRNPWSDYVSKIFFGGANISNWNWKSQDLEKQARQLSCFGCLLGGWGLRHEDKEAIAGWMLSEMLTETPEYIAS